MYAIHLTDWDVFLLQRAVVIAFLQSDSYSHEELIRLRSIYASMRADRHTLRITPYTGCLLGTVIQRLQRYDERDNAQQARYYDPHDYAGLKNKVRKEN